MYDIYIFRTSIATDFHTIGRICEVMKMLATSLDCIIKEDALFCLLITTFRRFKTGTTSRLHLGLEAEHFEICAVHAIADLLGRQGGMSPWLLPHLHDSSNYCTQVNNVIKLLTKLLPANLIEKFSINVDKPPTSHCVRVAAFITSHSRHLVWNKISGLNFGT